MALKEFTTQQMVRVTGYWVGKGRSIIASNPDIVGSLPVLDRAHQGLHLPAKASTTGATSQLAEVIGKQKVADTRHDRSGRGLIYLLQAYAQFAKTREEEAAFERALVELFPLHLDTTTQSYEEEAGAVELLASKLDTFKDLLSSMPLPGSGNAYTKALEHIEAGREIGELEPQKNKLQSDLGSVDNPSVLAARIYWIRSVRAFLSLLDVSHVSEEDKKTLLAPVVKAEAVAARRRGGEDVPEEEVEVDEGGAD